jgi:hypothetical protein
MRKAFKEWAVICQALASGRQIVIFRKGGIVEEGGRFRPDYPEFLLFPTYSHQSPECLLPEARKDLDEIERGAPGVGEVIFRHSARITDVLRLESIESIPRFRGEHIWSDDVVEERFHRWGEDGVYAMIVRVLRLPSPVTLELKEGYTGCKSCVELEESVATEGAVPVLTDEEFATRRQPLLNR